MYLSRRSDWLGEEKEFDGFVQENRGAFAAYARRLRDAPLASESTSAEEVDGILDAIENLSIPTDLTLNNIAIKQFLRHYPLGSVDLLDENLTGFQFASLAESTRLTHQRDPNAYLSATNGRRDAPSSLSAAQVLEALLARNRPHILEAFIVRRPDSSLIFRTGARVEAHGFGLRGLRVPRGVTTPIMRLFTPTTAPSRLLMDGLRQARYTASAAEATQRFLFRLFDPLGYRSSQGYVDPTSWFGAIRTFQRIVELTYAVQVSSDVDMQRELMLSLMDLHSEFYGSMLPSHAQLERGRKWLPPDMRAVEAARTPQLLADVVDEIWDGLVLDHDENQVRLPNGRNLGRVPFAQQFLRALRNVATHGYHTTQNRDALDGPLNVHSGHFPISHTALAIPMLEALIGDPEQSLRRFGRQSSGKR
ncbi:MAG: hypothetical protein O2924_05015 [Chloroflexi bacterium]|nr:hypothetical protein [Chloroflexota bacterium]